MLVGLDCARFCPPAKGSVMRWETAGAIVLVGALREFIYGGHAARVTSWTVASVHRLLLTHQKGEQRGDLLEAAPQPLRALPPPLSHHELGE